MFLSSVLSLSISSISSPILNSGGYRYFSLGGRNECFFLGAMWSGAAEDRGWWGEWGRGEADCARGVGQSAGVPLGGGMGEMGTEARGEMGREASGDMGMEKEEKDSGVDLSTKRERPMS